MPAEGMQLDRVGSEPVVGNHLLAKGTDGANISKCLWSSDPQSLSDRMTDKYRNPSNPQSAKKYPHADLMQKPGNLAMSEHIKAINKS